MKRVLAALLAAALTAGSMPVLTSGLATAGAPPPKAGGHGCCASMPCCEAGPPCSAGVSACAVSTKPADTSSCSLRAVPCGGPSARAAVVAVDPMIRPGLVLGIEAPGPAETVAAPDRSVARSSMEPAVPPPRG